MPSAELSAGHALAFARLSGAIYEEWPVFRQKALEIGFTVEDTWEHRETQGALVRGPEAAAIVFRGTEASKARLRDLWSNFGWPSAWAGQGLAHSGYARHLDKIALRVFEAANQVPSEIPLYLTGHSMGGAVASLAASLYYTVNPGWKLAGLVSFGAPKAMDRRACRAIGCAKWRFVNRYDFAPFWPPSVMLTHPGDEIALDSGGWWGPVSRHGVGKYIEALERAAR